jgi:hypothetical protein
MKLTLTLFSTQNQQNQTVSPKEYFVCLLELIGKTFCTCDALTSIYFSEPTELQLLSCGSYLNDIVCSSRDSIDLEMYLSCGVSLNPTNEYGDSLVHQLCRRGDDVLLDTFVRCYNRRSTHTKEGTRNNETRNPFQISNFMGRTPLHETCCSPKTRFRIVDIILRYDPYLLFVTDRHGYTPLDYVSIDQWPKWIIYLNAKFPEYFNETTCIEPPLDKPLSHTSVFGSNRSLSPEMANLVATGQLSPKNAMKYLQGKDSVWQETKRLDVRRGWDQSKTSSDKCDGTTNDQVTGLSDSHYDDIPIQNRLLSPSVLGLGLHEDEYDTYAFYVRVLPKIASSLIEI